MPRDDGLMLRQVDAEWLDILPADAPASRRSRRDLRCINWWMGHVAAMAGLVRRARGRSDPPRLVDIGAGDGRFMLAVARRLGPGWAGTRAMLLDRHDVVTDATLADFAALGWSAGRCTGDIYGRLDALHAGEVDLICANLVLHQFEEPLLLRILAAAGRAQAALAALEPRRSTLALHGCRLLPLIGCDPITLYDSRVSVQAGFRGLELSALWRTACGESWTLRESPHGLFSQAFLAMRPGSPP